MEKTFSISIYLDTRRAKKDDKYPVKLRVFTKFPRKQKLYATSYAYTEEEFEDIWIKKKKKFNKERLKLMAAETQANAIAERLPKFTFEAFEQKLFSKSARESTVNSYYDKTIEELRKNDQINTAALYELSKKSLLAYQGKEKLEFHQITPAWLRGFEKDSLENRGRSKTTVSMYLRALRAIFNNALSDGVITKDEYPFGKRKYNIPSPKGTKKALTREQLKTLYEADPSTDDQQKAKDFWFFSYICNGMNFKDIATLKYKNLSEETLTFSRAKTSSTDADQAPVLVYLTDYAKGIIEKHGQTPKSPDKHIFPIIDPNESADKQHRQIKNFVRFVNQHFIKFAKKAGVNEKISTYWARHSFATNAIRSGASMEYVSEALSHSSLQTTRSYFAGFEDEKKKEIAKKLMDFE